KSINPFKKELHTQQIKEQLEKQIKEKIEEYKLLPSQAIKLHTKMGMSLSLLVIGTVFSPNHKKEISETIEREIVCKECKGTGMLDFEQNKNKKAKD
ncbi:MAG: hypothetical protein SFU99_00065, partial [Saprospiraceae bacterium]|nr:hypothetical protein [Saprospiraceae bacterium]